MDLLTGYTSSDSEAPTPQNKPLLRPAGINAAAPLPSISKAVLRSKGVMTTRGDTALVAGAIQGPALLSDPADTTTSFIAAINPKTGSTSKMESNVHVDEFTFAANRNAFQRDTVAVAPGDSEREIRRDDYGHQRRFQPNYGEDWDGERGKFKEVADEVRS
jgi:hypothetical protein